jgi:outer membrane receptor protein involved in Fe transport
MPAVRPVPRRRAARNRALLAGLAGAYGSLAAAQPGVLEEVVVTAAKREQTLQEVPVAVSVVSGETLEQAQVLDIKDLQTLVPSLRVTQQQTSGNTNFLIRGFGNGANNAGIEPSVGVFIDGVYRSRVGSALADLPKLERIEVLRGPQSTLFGKNASAGVINVVTARPDLAAFGGSVSATVGNYDQTLVRGDVTGPVSDSLAFSLFGSYNRRDGYFKNLESGADINELDRWTARGQLLWLPTDSLELRLIVDGESLDEACCGVANLLDGPTGDVVRSLGGRLVPNDVFAYKNYYDFDPSNEIDTRGASLQVDWDLGGMTLTSISAYRELEQYQNSDVDFTSARLVAVNAGTTDIETFTQELRLTSSAGDRLDWMLGAFYFDEEVKITNDFRYDDQFRDYADALSGGGVTLFESILGLFDPSITPGTFFAPGQGYPDERAGQDDETLSLFAQGDWRFSDVLTLTLGANYTRSEKDAYVGIVATDVFSAIELPPPAAALAPLQFLPPFLDFPNAVEDGQSDDDEVTWTARLAWDVSANLNAYIGASTGFKPTSWNLSRDSRPFARDLPALEAAGLTVPNLTTGTRFAGPEESTVYEVGVKAEYDSVAFNLAVFYQEIEGFQSNIFSGTGFQLANAGKQSVEGFEFDIDWAPLDRLRLAFAVTYLDPEYDSFPEGSGVDGPEDLSGTRPAGIHEWSTNTSAVYNFSLGSAADAYLRLEHIYEDEVPTVENVPPELSSREVNMFNASFGVYFANGIELNLWGRNLNEDEYILQSFPSVAQAGSYSSYPNQPRTYGLTLRKVF